MIIYKFCKKDFVSFSAIFSPLVILNISIVSQNLWDGKDFAIPVPWDGKVFAIPGIIKFIIYR